MIHDPSYRPRSSSALPRHGATERPRDRPVSDEAHRPRRLNGTKVTTPEIATKGNFTLFLIILTDLRAKAKWCYESDRWPSIIKTLLTDGTPAMIFYRLMQWSHRHRLAPLAMIFNKINTVCCNCIIGRGADFGPGFVLIHATGVVINATVRGGANVFIEHQVTIGAERRQSPSIGNDVFLGAGAKVLGSITIGDGARIGANAVVLHDIPAHATAVGIPARVVRLRSPDLAETDAERPS